MPEHKHTSSCGCNHGSKSWREELFESDMVSMYGRNALMLFSLLVILKVANSDAFSIGKGKAVKSQSQSQSQSSGAKKTISTSSPSRTSRLFVSQQMPSDSDSAPAPASTGTGSSSTKSLQERLSNAANFASLLCVVDCTLLPLVTVLLPVIGLGASSSMAKTVHDLGHSLAMFFVLPVGGLASTMNYLNHKKKSLAALAGIGLSCVYAANAGHGAPLVSLLPSSMAHKLHCGSMIHRAVNICGCACLLSSNYLGRKIGGCAQDSDCCADKKQD
eukprot:227784_1